MRILTCCVAIVCSCGGSSDGTLGTPPSSQTSANDASVSNGDEGGAAARDACQPRTCADLGVSCGLAVDGCGVRLDCGPCDIGAEAGGATADATADGPTSACGRASAPSCCTSDPCAMLQAACGTVPDGCGGISVCAACPSYELCIGNTCLCKAGHSTADGGCQ